MDKINTKVLAQSQTHNEALKLFHPQHLKQLPQIRHIQIHDLRIHQNLCILSSIQSMISPTTGPRRIQSVLIDINAPT
jgi:hypothetical protein